MQLYFEDGYRCVPLTSFAADDAHLSFRALGSCDSSRCFRPGRRLRHFFFGKNISVPVSKSIDIFLLRYYNEHVESFLFRYFINIISG